MEGPAKLLKQNMSLPWKYDTVLRDLRADYSVCISQQKVKLTILLDKERLFDTWGQ